MTTLALTCIHHWEIASPNGGDTVPGTCKYCGETRDFLTCEPLAGFAMGICRECGHRLPFNGLFFQKNGQGLTNLCKACP